jgi:hypothetical protein
MNASIDPTSKAFWPPDVGVQRAAGTHLRPASQDEIAEFPLKLAHARDAGPFARDGPAVARLEPPAKFIIFV